MVASFRGAIAPRAIAFNNETQYSPTGPLLRNRLAPNSVSCFRMELQALESRATTNTVLLKRLFASLIRVSLVGTPGSSFSVCPMKRNWALR